MGNGSQLWIRMLKSTSCKPEHFDLPFDNTHHTVHPPITQDLNYPDPQL